MTTAIWAMLILSVISIVVMFVIVSAVLVMCREDDHNKDHHGVDAQFQAPTNNHDE